MFSLVHAFCWYVFPRGPTPRPPPKGPGGAHRAPPGPRGPSGPLGADGASRRPRALVWFSCEMFSMSEVIQIGPECPRKAQIEEAIFEDENLQLTGYTKCELSAFQGELF